MSQSPKSKDELSVKLEEVKKSPEPDSSGSQHAEETAVSEVNNGTDSAEPANSGSQHAEETAVSEVNNGTESAEPANSGSQHAEETAVNEVDNGNESKLKPPSQSHQEEEPQPGPSSAPDAPPVEIEDELQACFEDVISSFGNVVQALLKVSIFHTTKGVNPLLHAVSRQMPELLGEMKKSVLDFKYSSEIFRESKVKFAESCIDLMKICDMVRNYVMEAKDGASSEEVTNSEMSKLIRHLDERLGNLKPKMRALEDIIVNPGDFTKEDTERLLGGPLKGRLQLIQPPQPPPRIRGIYAKKTEYFSIALIIILILMFILLVTSMMAKKELDALKKLLREKAKHLGET